MRKLKIYAASTGAVFGAQPENYGDNLMTPLLRELYDIEPIYVAKPYADLIGIGSILDSYYRHKGSNPLKRRPWRELHVWGSGFMNQSGKPFWPQRVTFHAVRGPLSRGKIGLPTLPMGDPAILIPQIWPKPATPTCAVSIVPHFITHRDFVRDYGTSLPRHWKIIDLLTDPRTISEQIAASELVISSSLHGLILADAYEVPSIWMRGDSRIKGGDFKFRDYEAFRGEQFESPFEFADILRRMPKPSPPRPARETVVTSLLRAMPFG